MKKITFLLAVLITAFGFSQTVVQDFEDGDGPYGEFGGAFGSVVANPSVDTNNPSANVTQVIASAGGQVWQGINVTVDQNVEVYTANPTMDIDVYSTTPLSILVKVTASTDGGPESATSVTHGGSGWETLTATFNTSQDGTAPANGTYSNFVVYPNWDAGANNYITPAIDRTIYIDNIAGIVPTGPTCSDGMQNGDETGVDCGGSCPNSCPTPPAAAPTTPPARAAADVKSVYSNAYTPEATDGAQLFGGATTSEIDFSGNSIVQVNTPGPGAGLQYQYFGVPFLNLSAMTHMHIDFYFEGAAATPGTVFLVIAQYSDGTNIQKTYDVTTLAQNTWHETDIAFADFDLNATYPRDAIQQVIVQIAGPDNYGPFYYDNLYFHNNMVLSTDQFDTAEFSVFPNPTNGEWNINSTTEMSKVSLFDILGKEVLTITPNTTETTIDASTFKTGVYFARIEGVSGTKTVKLVRQ